MAVALAVAVATSVSVATEEPSTAVMATRLVLYVAAGTVLASIASLDSTSAVTATSSVPSREPVLEAMARVARRERVREVVFIVSGVVCVVELSGESNYSTTFSSIQQCIPPPFIYVS
mgnify:CR=1 FL=1